jgi:hypothetical protein
MPPVIFRVRSTVVIRYSKTFLVIGLKALAGDIVVVTAGGLLIILFLVIDVLVFLIFIQGLLFNLLSKLPEVILDPQRVIDGELAPMDCRFFCPFVNLFLGTREFVEPSGFCTTKLDVVAELTEATRGLPDTLR